MTRPRIVEKTAASEVREPTLASRDSEHRQISRLNDDFPELVVPTLIHYPGDSGREIEAALFRSEGRARRGGHPTVVLDKSPDHAQ